MKKSIVCAVLVLLLTVSSAFAESPVGTWSGRGSIMGWMTGSCSATFKDNGRVTMSSGGYSLTGRWSDGVIRVGYDGDSIKVKYKINDDGSMTMTSYYSGFSGKATLRRKGGKAANNAHTVYGIWKNEDGAVVKLYSAGYFHYTWTEVNEDGETVQRDFISTLSESEEDKSVLVLTPFETEAAETEAEETEQTDAAEEAAEEEAQEIEPILVTGKVSGETLTLTYNGTDYAYTWQEASDAKPESDLFVPYVALQKDDRGQAVKKLQEQLTQAGCLDDKIDGIYGPKTEAAVLLYEQNASLTEDGIADEEVRAMLLEEFPAEAEN